MPTAAQRNVLSIGTHPSTASCMSAVCNRPVCWLSRDMGGILHSYRVYEPNEYVKVGAPLSLLKVFGNLD